MAGPRGATPTPPPTPVDGTPSPFPTTLHTPRPGLRPPAIRATGALLEDLDSGQVLFGRKPNTRRPVASLTKIMTALLVLERMDVDRAVTVSAHAASTPPSGLDLTRGERMIARTLLYGMLMQSANDAAVALAEAAAGSESRFVALMNDRARSMGLERTVFYSPNGLDNRGRSTPTDLARLTAEAERLPLFARIVRTRTKRLDSLTGPTRTVQNRNILLWLYPGTVGVKTGFTTPAGHCLVGIAERDGRRLLVVVLGAPEDQFGAGAALLNYGFDAFVLATLLAQGEGLGTIDVDGRRVDVAGSATVERLVRRDRAGDIHRTVIPSPALHLPIAAGQRVGTVVVFAGSERVARAPVVAAAGVPAPEATAGPPSSPAGPSDSQPIEDVAVVLRLLVRTMFGAFL